MSPKNATQSLPADTRSYEHDGKVPGLSLRRGAGGASWYFYYRTKSGRQRRPKIGSAEVITRSQARDIAREMAVLVARGEDPAGGHDRHGRTVADLMARFEREHKPHVKPKTWSLYQQVIDLHVLPSIGHLSLSDVNRTDIANLHLKMKDTPYMANRMLAVMHKAFSLAENEWEWIGKNPVRVRRFREHQRRRYPQPDEATRLIKAIDSARTNNPYFVALVELLILTGCRVGEILNAKWEWVHADGLHLPDSKGGAKIVPLNSYARDVLSEIPTQRDNPYIICGRRKGKQMNNPTGMWGDLLNAAEITDLRMHDLRRYFASVALSRGLALETVGQLLGHRQAQTTKRYAYLMTDAASAASQSVGDAIMAKC